MTLTIHWLTTNKVVTYHPLTQKQVNDYINHVSNLQEQYGHVPLRITVTD